MEQGLLAEPEARTEVEEGMRVEEGDGMEAGAEDIGAEGTRADSEGAGVGSLDTATSGPAVAGGTEAEEMA